MTDQLFIDQAKKGNCYCQGCGEPKIAPSEGWKPWCSNCFAMQRDRKYCRNCANPLEKDRVAYAKRKGGVCTQCLYCAKGWTEPHPVHGVRLPTRFYASLR